ncbi:AI-2E family transporter [Nocardioides daejeonensis]|uniref:AI-2E family transporter n=1 Tax=Nocardioides daejeonensis TaxID=1046556 RepID=UPI001EF509B1|nr:AI-2E family transporter [Nocardioides daejeonensis]
MTGEGEERGAREAEGLDKLDHRDDKLDHRDDKLDHRDDGLDHRDDGLDHRGDELDHRDDGLEHREGVQARRLAQQFTQQLAQQWASMRAERKSEPTPILGGASNLRRAEVPWGLDLAAAWSWRFLVISAALLAMLWLSAYFVVVTMPLVIALLVAALSAPVVRWLHRIGIPRGLAALLVVISGVAAVGALLTFVGQQIADDSSKLASQVATGLQEIRDWLQDGPLHASDSQINDWLETAQKAVTERSKETDVVGQVTEVGTALGHVLAGFFIVLFATYFFLAEGDRIWAWVVRMFPRGARERVDSSGKVAWVSLTQFVRATVLVALVDAAGIALVAVILKVPLALPIGVLVFLGAFVPMIGATIAGSVAVLVALVAQGPWTALLMLIGVIVVQQVEGHVLQPFLMGRWVSVHPLAVILAIACGVVVAGVAGALVAVPLAAVINAVVQHLASFAEVVEEVDDAVQDALEGPGPEGAAT